MNIVILGTGHIAQAHCRQITQLPGVKISAVVSRSGGHALPGAEKARHLQQISELSALEQQPDLALVCLPSFLHRGAVEALCPLVPNIICEKPAALSLADGTAMAESARVCGCNLMVAQVLRAWDSYSALNALLCAGRRTLHTLTLRRRQPRPAWSAGDWLLDETKSGGILFDLAIHEIDFVTNLFGSPTSVSGSFGPNRESVTLMLEYEGFCAVIEDSWCLPKSYAKGGMETHWEAAFTDRLAVFDSLRDHNSYENYADTRETVPFPTWDPYKHQLSQLIAYAGQRINPFSIETVLPALAVCQTLADRLPIKV